MDFDLNETRENAENEQIYESIDECVRRSSPGPSNEFRGPTQLTSCGMSMTQSVNAKNVLKTGADKLCDTFNNVKTKFGTLSQRLRKSTRRRTPLINSPGTPQNINLGRTPVKMSSPFCIETPRGRENAPARRSLNRESFKKTTPTKNRRRNNDLKGISEFQASPQLAKDMRETRIQVLEFQHLTQRVLQNFYR